MSDFYILSLKRSKRRDGILTWWRPANADYAFRLEWSGRYTHEQVEARRSYYDNGETTRAVPCEEVERVAQKVRDTRTNALDRKGLDERVVAYCHLTKLRKAWLPSC